MNPRVRALVVLVAVFLVGGAMGSALYYLYSAKESGGPPNSPPQRDRNRPKLSQILQLSSEQEAKFKEVMSDSRRQFEAARKEQETKFDAIRAEMNARIMGILNDDQKLKFQAFQKEIDSKRPRHRGEPPPPRPGGNPQK
jgi:Spy/CpxP family protein refolding chaperone